MSMTETYPHRCMGPDDRGFLNWNCRCGAHPVWYSELIAMSGWGSDCPAALREALAMARKERDAARERCATVEAQADEYRHQRDAAHDQLSDIAALVAGELAPDDRTGGAPELHAAWEAVKGQLGALVRECWEHTRCMGERDAALARVAELEATLTTERADRRTLEGSIRALLERHLNGWTEATTDHPDQPEMGPKPTLAGGVVAMLAERDAALAHIAELEATLTTERAAMIAADAVTKRPT